MSRTIRGEHPYQQHIDVPDRHEEYPGKSAITTDHDVIRNRAQQRGGQPSTVSGSEYGGRVGRPLFGFPGYGGENRVHISWEEWFESFDERGLDFIFQEHRKDGDLSNLFRLENPDGE